MHQAVVEVGTDICADADEAWQDVAALRKTISEIAGGLGDIGYTIPGQAWTYWNRGPGPGPSYSETGEGHEWSENTGRTMAANLHAVALALAERPIPS